MKTLVVLTVALTMSVAVSVSAQEAGGSASTSFRSAPLREGIVLPRLPKPLLAQTSTPSRSTRHSWRTQHPVAFGAIVGAIAGSAVGSGILAAGCHGGGEGVCSPAGAVSWIGMFTGIGAGSGAAIGAFSKR